MTRDEFYLFNEVRGLINMVHEKESKKQTKYEKQSRYLNLSGSKDLIDRWAEEKTRDQFRVIMIAQIEKYCSRYGKKDQCINEANKIADYAQRLAKYEEDKLDGL